jgi:phosphocarrier protein
MIERKLKVKNKLGIHARPATLIAKTANKYKAELKIEKDGMKVDGKSIIGLMILEAEMGSKIKIITKGEDELKLMEDIVKLIEEKFGEE